MENQQVSLTITPQQLHKSVRNVLVNELDLSKKKIDDMIKEIVEERVDKILQNHILNSTFLHSLIEHAVFKMIAEGVKTGYWYEEKNMPFTKFIQNETSKAIQAAVLKQFEIKIEEKSK